MAAADVATLPPSTTEALSPPSTPRSPSSRSLQRSSSWTNICKRCKTLLSPRYHEEECTTCAERYTTPTQAPNSPRQHNPIAPSSPRQHSTTAAEIAQSTPSIPADATSPPTTPRSPAGRTLQRSSSWTNICKRCKTLLSPRYHEEECTTCAERFTTIQTPSSPRQHYIAAGAPN